jgi:hypothetical protein
MIFVSIHCMVTTKKVTVSRHRRPLKSIVDEKGRHILKLLRDLFVMTKCKDSLQPCHSINLITSSSIKHKPCCDLNSAFHRCRTFVQHLRQLLSLHRSFCQSVCLASVTVISYLHASLSRR